jgi:hypothetical protein
LNAFPEISGSIAFVSHRAQWRLANTSSGDGVTWMARTSRAMTEKSGNTGKLVMARFSRAIHESAIPVSAGLTGQ